MKKEIFETKNAPAPVGPYSQAVGYGDLLFCSGQVSLTADGSLILDDIQAQTKQVMENVGEVLKAADLNYSNVIKTMIFLTDMNDFAAVNEIYGSYFKEEPPARSCVAVSSLPKGVNVEVEVLAGR